MASQLHRVEYRSKERLFRWLLILGVTGAISGYGNAAEDSAGSADLQQIARYPLSWIVDYSKDTAPEYRLATGAMKKINGVVAPEFQQDLSGMLTRITYQLPSGHSSKDVFEYFKGQFDALAPEVLYRCEARGCGDSNQWANVQFGISKLYGVDREQYYMALKFPAAESESPSYLAFYTVMRGNKRVYAQLDWIQPRSEASVQKRPSLIDALEQGKRVFRQFESLLPTEVGALKQRMLDRPTLTLILVGHSDQSGTAVQQYRASLDRAEAIKQQLVKQGLDGSRVVTYGVGALAPAYDPSVPSQRVEWLLQSR